MISSQIERKHGGHGAACGCADLKALIFWPLIYTNCQKHGVVEIGYLRREYSNGNGRRK